MAVTPYKKGSDFERDVVELFRSAGWSVARVAGSKGLYDVVAENRQGKTYYIQCKLRGAISVQEWNDLFFHSVKYRGLAAVAKKDERGGIRLDLITGPKHDRNEGVPSIEFSVPDENCWDDERSSRAKQTTVFILPPQSAGVTVR